MEDLNIDVVGGGLKKYVPDKSGILNRAISAFYVSPIGGGVASYHRKKEKKVLLILCSEVFIEKKFLM